jgi:pSer/pThr/pTyr-binding forkhead associated (FHA) protein
MKRAILRDEVTGKIHKLDVLAFDYGGKVIIGRNSDSAILLVEKPRDHRYSSSRIHAVILYDGKTDTYSIQDKDSSRGTFINGSPLEESADLKDGDNIAFGPWYGPVIFEEVSEEA